MAMDFNDKATDGVKFTPRTKKLIHEIAIMCNNNKTLSSFMTSSKRDRYIEEKDAEDVLVDMITLVTEGMHNGDKSLELFLPMILIPIMDDMLRTRDRIAQRNNQAIYNP
jgi:hypothetical protein